MFRPPFTPMICPVMYPASSETRNAQVAAMSAACAFLVSEDASYITGQILGVNGGRNT